MDIGDDSPDENGQGVKLTTCLHPVLKYRMKELYFHSPIRLHDVVFH
jgi:hypothetical protein